LKLKLAVGLALVAAAVFAQSPQDGFQRERGGKGDELKNSMEGKAPPKLDFEKWLNTNGKPLAWTGLKGKVVVLDFWAYW